jgi:hypothetical protein
MIWLVPAGEDPGNGLSPFDQQLRPMNMCSPPTDRAKMGAASDSFLRAWRCGLARRKVETVEAVWQLSGV